MTIGNKILELRKKSNYTQERLATELEVSRQTIANWESDITSPDLKQASVLAHLFHITIDELIDGKLEIECKQSYTILQNLIGQKCYFDIGEDDYRIGASTVCTVLEVNSDFIKIEFDYGNKKITKLMDLDLIYSIRNRVK